MDSAQSVSTALARLIAASIERNSGWLPFDRYMALALYAPGLGYYARHNAAFGAMPQSGSDFVTAPELSPLFGRALARQVAQALVASDTREIWEFGAGSGLLAAQLLETLDAAGAAVERYTIVEVSAPLAARQRQLLAAHGDRVRWAEALPDTIRGVVIGNEVLDAMPVRLLAFDGTDWLERGVIAADASVTGGPASDRRGPPSFGWADRPTDIRPPHADVFTAGSVTEVHPQAVAFVTTLAERLVAGAAFFIDYGFPAAEYYHPQRDGGTLMCHRAHTADDDPLVDVGAKDITAHLDFTSIALAAQDAGAEVLGYTSQARFLINCGVIELLEGADLRTTANAQKLVNEHEMGELFKVIGFARGCDPAFMAAPLGFARGDRTHTL